MEYNIHMTQMTPQEIHDYRMKWRYSSPNYIVTTHSDSRSDVKQWCKNHLQKQEWELVIWTDVYEDTVYFETLEMQTRFMDEFVLPRYRLR